MIRFGLVVFAALSSVAAAAAAPAPPFTCAAPPDWSARRRPDGIVFSGPRDENGVASVIAIRYVGADNKLYATADEYVRRLTAKPDVAIPGRSVGTPTSASVAGRAARRVVSDVSDFVPPHSLKSKEVPVREEDLVVPAARGFYVVSFRAPRALFVRTHPTFARLLESFRPKL
jgi:hypothetical protein